MSKKIRISTVLLIMGVFFLLLLSANAPVTAQEGRGSGSVIASGAGSPAAGIDSIVPGGPGFISINPGQLRPYSESMDWAYSMFSLYNPDDSVGVFITGLNIPDGLTLNRLVSYYYDASDVNVFIYLMRCKIDVGSCYVIAQTFSDGSETFPRYSQDDTIDNGLIDNQQYTYGVEVDIPAGAGINLRLISIRIDYEAATNFLPIIIK